MTVHYSSEGVGAVDMLPGYCPELRWGLQECRVFGKGLMRSTSVWFYVSPGKQVTRNKISVHRHQ
jgi:hypothetical protein